ncbi:MAG: YdeI/OmpD-associated family protein [Microscillaceae bacterium]|jgi:uncharacterized protein YdeI (YjbR/CyaY-like superfamily)|nr:YdeI/OmpD-associated family protein [Microscillaceae bacterium]
MPKFAEDFEHFYPPDRATWRAWLANNHASKNGVWLIYYKKNSDKPSIAYPDAVKEALCYGWIDSKVNKLDEFSYKQVFTPRKPKSVWSKVNKAYLEELLAQNLMTEAGLKTIEIAKQNGAWSSIDEIENLILPADFAEALQKNPIAASNYETFAKTAKKSILLYITGTKKPEVRAARIDETVKLAEQNIKNDTPYRQKQKKMPE